MEIQFVEGAREEGKICKIHQVKTEKVIIVFEDIEYTAHFDASKNLVITKFSKSGSTLQTMKPVQINEVRIK